ncbi:Stk1 family PASTA domain-containing Ser/Thr kinase [Brachybacterium sp. J144]|uniref:Stk1 family PASTA domain-containing Ser/Thr kinase n=1 Tax=Brachybacterium sp. J144 TaxID=3116487 RepID=UPI002E779121|nr:Stk1 family PASTA domain-containing Ser/Thr kinase [Brachybacterium sp. J144]MEE1651312.1 Stk1 family PASTA domain-containing Ser/Thr kinase [Brachybacterium sp. J144]
MSSATSTSPGISQLLDDRYRVEEPIARGGMATVHRGHDLRLDRVVALKIMHPHLAMDEDFRRRFGREARAAARLAHRNVVGVFDQGADADRIYLAMELIEGPTLRARIAEEERLTVRAALDVTAQVLEAMVAAHGAGIVHRDIKPENILIDPHGVVKVADFGLARAIGTSNSSASTTLLGTVAYISPEVVTRGHCDERSDLYSLGVVLFEMLTGRQPFVGEQPVHIAFQHVHEDIPAPSTLVTRVPRELDSLVTWAAARPVEQRPATAADLLRAVRELQSTLPAAVLDARPTPREAPEDLSTGEIPQLTTPLEEVVSSLDGDPRAFPVGLLGEAVQDADGETVQHAAAEPGSAVIADGETEPGSDAPVVDADTAASSPREVALRTPRARRGRHLPLGARRRSRAVAALATLSLIASLGASGWAGGDWYLNSGPGADRTIPAVAGSDLADAEAVLGAADLTTRTVERFDDTVPAGQVISADPSPGSTVKKGTAVEVVVSKGVETFPVPALTGLSLEEARSTVEAASLELVEDERQYSETVPEGEVISQSQEAEALPAGGEVHVVVSQGRMPITIPDQTGRGGDAARSTLQDAGFDVSVSSAHHSSVPAGAVISQSPASGTGYRGDTISIVTSLGPEMVTVPDVFQQPEADARAALEAAGFVVAVQYDRGDPVFGLVYQQSATAGTELAKGSTVTLTVF